MGTGRLKLLEEIFKKEPEMKEQTQPITRDLTESWPEELDVTSLVTEEDEQKATTDLFDDRLKRLEEHFHKSPQVKEQKQPISRDMTAERTAWLLEQCRKPSIVCENKHIVSTDHVAGRQRKLEEQFHKEPEMKVHNEPISRELTTERAAWLEGQNKNVYIADECNRPVSNELITGRLKLLEEIFKKEPEMKEQTQPITRDLAESTSWLTKESEKSPTTKDEHPISTGLIANRLKWLKDKFGGDSNVNEQKQQPFSKDLWDTISQNLISERTSKFEERIREKERKRKRSNASSTHSNFLRSRSSRSLQHLL